MKYRMWSRTPKVAHGASKLDRAMKNRIQRLSIEDQIADKEKMLARRIIVRKK